MYSEEPVNISVEISFANDILTRDYTAKLVKSLLINGNPKLDRVFAKGKSPFPKPIHITPLYMINEAMKGKYKAIYAKFIPKNSIAKPPINRIEPVRIKSGEKYFFYIGTNIELLNDVLFGLSNGENFQFGKETVKITHCSYSIEYIDLKRKVEEIKKKLEDKSINGHQVKAVFKSPTLLKDPLIVMRKKKKKVLLPLPEAILSVPIFMVLIDQRKMRSNIFLRCMRYIKSAFDIPYTVLKTVNIAWYVYDNDLLPALIGYVKYFIDPSMLYYAQQLMEMKYGIDFLEILSKAIALANIYGVGDGRATGFGHVSLKL